MDQVKLVIHLHQRFRGPEKEISAEIEAAEKMVNHLRLRSAIKIDQHIAAEDQVHALHEKHPGVVLQIQAAESDYLFHLREHLQFLLIDGREIFASKIIRGRAQSVIAIDAGLGGFHGVIVEIGGNNLNCPAFQQAIT